MDPQSPVQPAPFRPPLQSVVPPVPIQHAPPILPVNPPIPPIKRLKLGIIIILALLVFGLVVLMKSLINDLGNFGGKPIVTPTLSPTPAFDETINWQTHKIEKLGIEFKLPEYLSQLDYPKGNETKGEKGIQFCIEYIKVGTTSFLVKNAIAGGGACLPQYFGLGTTSVDYEAGRMGGFGDLQGYALENSKYFAKTVLGRKYEIPPELANEITNSNGVKILRVVGKDDEPSEKDMPAFPIQGTPGKGKIGALINLGNLIYPGVAIEMKLDEQLTMELFDQILSTFKFSD